MSDINEEYYVLVCGSGKVPSPYVADTKSHYLMLQSPASLKRPIQVETAADPNDSIPLIEAMAAPSDPVISERVKKVIEYFDLYKVQLFPAIYTHNDESEYSYYILVVENVINAYDFNNGKYFEKEDDGSVDAINFRLDANKLAMIPLEKRCIFTIRGMSEYLVHRSVAEPLMALNASGLRLVPLLQWDIGFEMTV
ncbi:imm11 family protein [Vibrio japonicus]|uniref:Uncharacterized protein n=1 Tax=Vibrio japonicus TaxID=1824638 RepID=A0ABY5LK88_9VIBR|nr:DUF1629 domain-containing protein [Vibrio japonicus]UUM32474.1 hypothetical protein NP165_19585 [Vibrio japonicus]